MSKIALTPMLVQYLVGLCCLRWDPEAIDVTIGDMVLDEAADKERDVDVTVTVAESDGTKSAFKAYEVKREGSPLDVADVEALCLKLLDMPSISHRAIVSSSASPPVHKQRLLITVSTCSLCGRGRGRLKSSSRYSRCEELLTSASQ